MFVAELPGKFVPWSEPSLRSSWSEHAHLGHLRGDHCRLRPGRAGDFKAQKWGVHGVFFAKEMDDFMVISSRKMVS